MARFLVERERLLLKLQRELLAGRYRPGPMTRFVIHDPKLRTISVALFRDRVVHHAVVDVLEPILDRRMIHASFACRQGKGTHAAHAALDYAQRLVRRHGWFLKMDVARCFASIPHALVMTTLARIIKDRAVLGLGFLLFPALRRIRPANRKRVVQRWKLRQWQWREGELNEAALADCVRSMMAHLEHGTTRAWRRRWCAQLERGGPM